MRKGIALAALRWSRFGTSEETPDAWLVVRRADDPARDPVPRRRGGEPRSAWGGATAAREACGPLVQRAAFRLRRRQSSCPGAKIVRRLRKPAGLAVWRGAGKPQGVGR